METRYLILTHWEVQRLLSLLIEAQPKHENDLVLSLKLERVRDRFSEEFVP